MVRLPRILCIFALLSTLTVHAETFSYELYVLDPIGPRLTKTAAREYSVGDSVVTRWPRDPKVMDKELPLGNGFTVGLTDHAEPRVTGLGFWLKRVPSPMEASQYPGFSWEWFDLSNSQVFEKRKGEGRILVQTRPVGGRALVERVEFLDDTTFQMNARREGAPGTYTHELRIKKGSVLVFLPEPRNP
jgi:hypothetical protein